ncbi:MAG: NusG domain II-containing protein [Eubacteriaceae bacterium]|nr:NusG domain II-containing protein [Eubacteriaceae bacterium]
MSTAVLAILIFFIYNKTQQYNLEVRVSQNGQIIRTLSLNQNYKETIRCSEGYNTIMIENGYASVSESDCPNQICVNSKAISSVGETIACLPHHLIIEIVQKENP